MADNPYPLSKFHFEVGWNGANGAEPVGFTEVSGLDHQIDPIEYRHGASPQYHKIKMPGLQKFSNITLKRGSFKGDNGFMKWLTTVALNKIERRTLTISLLDEEHKPLITWTIREAWPIKVQGTDLKADGNEVAVETIELAHEGLTVEFL